MTRQMSRWWWVLILPGAALICWLLATWIVNTRDYHNIDFFTFWLGGHLVTLKGDPYSAEQWLAGHGQFGVTWIPNQVYVYPLPLALLFTPLGLLPLKQAFTLWVALSILMILATLALLYFLKGSPNRTVLTISLLEGLILFRPSPLTLVGGQLSAGMLFLLACTAFLWQRDKWAWGSLLLPLLALKPNIGGPVILMLAAWLLFTRRWRSLLFLAAGGIVLLLAGLLLNPTWMQQYWTIGNAKMTQAFGFSPTVWGFSSLVCGFKFSCTLAAGGTAAGLIVTAALAFLFVKRTSLNPLWVISLAATVTLLVTPYTWPYDQLLLLLPIAVVTYSLGVLKNGFFQSILYFLGIDILCLLLLFISNLMKMEILNVFVPLVVLTTLLGMGLGRRASLYLNTST